MRETMNKLGAGITRWGLAICFLVVAGNVLHAEDDSELKNQLELFRRQNEQLQQQLRKQQDVIDKLNQRVSDLEGANQQRASEYNALKEEIKEPPGSAGIFSKPFSFGGVRISGEGGLAFFNSGSEGQYPNAAFRVDEAKLFVEAPLLEDIYFFTEIDITMREEQNDNLRASELYVDFENVSKLWNKDRQVNIRVGRMDIPFGEEYLERDAIDNPLISHSLSDLWGVDEGVELYGTIGKLNYVLAVQNGGIPTMQDFNADKAITARISYDPTKWLHTSVSAMRTGDLNASDDYLSAMWFGNGFFRALGTNDATKFHANLVEGDVSTRWSRGYVKAAGGYVRYNDNDTATNERRDMYYYYVLGVQNITDKFYTAARFSQIMVNGGYPIVGNGDFNEYFYEELTKNLWQLSLGGGYRWSRNLVLKIEYTIARGDEVGGGERNNEDLFAMEVAFRF